LLDTCAILWLAADSVRLSPAARQAISENRSELLVSAISAFEIGLKHRKGRLDLGMEPELWWDRATAHHGLHVVPVSDTIALGSTALPPLHADPCDRMIVATACEIAAGVVTSDPLIHQYPGVSIVW
jgi:PIN domain nuclease of toxin-antitoxin system